MSNETEVKAKVSVGLPIYNGEKLIHQVLKSILSQSFTNFELIISDNASTDSTSEICAEYAKKDKRIRYIRQDHNIGGLQNFYFLLRNARCEYFTWIGADDFWHPEFLMKNVGVLESNRNIVGSIGEVEFTQSTDFETIMNSNHKKFERYQHVCPAYGPLEKRLRTYLKFNKSTIIYAVFRTQELKKSIENIPLALFDLSIILNILKFGELHVVEEVLTYRYGAGASSKGIINLHLQHYISFFDMLFPFASFTVWFSKQFGKKIFLKNIDHFIWLNCFHSIRVIAIGVFRLFFKYKG